MTDGDEIERLIDAHNETALRALVLGGHGRRIVGRNFPAHSRDLVRTLANLNVSETSAKKKSVLCSRSRRAFQLRVAAAHQAAADGDLRAVKQLIDSDELALCRDAVGHTPLHTSVGAGRDRVAHYLLLLYPRCVDAVDKVCCPAPPPLNVRKAAARRRRRHRCCCCCGCCCR